MFEWFKKKHDTVKDEELLNEYGNLEEIVSKGESKSARSDQLLVERLEQMIDLAKETEELKNEYRIVNSYLNDIQMLEDMPEAERRPIEETALSVVQLNDSRTEFLNSAKKISDSQFNQMEREERDIPTAIKRLRANEVYRDTLTKDLKYLDREKDEWKLRKKFLHSHARRMKTVLYVLMGLAVTTALVFAFLQFVMKMDMYYAWMILVFATAVLVCITFIRMQNDNAEEITADRSINRAITLSNKVKLKYVSIQNAIDYSCEKYHVRSGSEFEQNWQYYQEAVKERKKYQQTSEDLDYFNGKLIRQLTAYRFYDARKWVSQANAILDSREMVEIKHEMISRRQMLRSQIEYNTKTMAEQKVEAEKLLSSAGDMRPQVEEILASVDKLVTSE